MRFSQSGSLFATCALVTSTLLSSTGLLASGLLVSGIPAAHAADAAPKPATPPTAAPQPDANAVVATVNGEKITLDDIRRAAANIPPQMRQLPQNLIFPMLVNQAVDQKAIQIAARKDNLQNQPDVKSAMDTAANTALQNAWLSAQVMPQLTDAAIHDYYVKNYANKQPEKEVHARHILVKTEAEAKEIIKKLQGGANFGTLAESLSTDKGSAKNNGGDLGWFKKGDMVPAFSDAAFAMKPNSYSQTPVKSQFGYHVIQVLADREVPAPKEDEVKDKIRQQLIQQDIRAAVEKATSAVKIVRFGPDGKPVPDAAQPAIAGNPVGNK